MGLDMYLYIEKYITRKDYKFEHNKVESFPNEKFDLITEALGCAGLLEDEERSTGYTINVPVGYWRKANAIHNWIIKNVAGGEDDCKPVYFPQEQIKVLLDTCVKVKEDNSLAMDLLPPTSGFFFGSTDIDEWYLSDLDHTIEVLTKLIESKNDDDVYYRASW